MPEALKAFMDGAKEPSELEDPNRRLHTMLTDLALSLSRMQPMTQRCKLKGPAYVGQRLMTFSFFQVQQGVPAPVPYYGA